MPIRRTLAILLAVCLVPAAALADEKKKDKGTYVTIDTLTAMVTAANGRHGVMTVQSGVDVPDPVLRALAEQDTPRLRAAYVEVLQAYAGGVPPGAPPDPDYVARRLQQATDRVLGKSGGRLLIGGIMIN
ncbi:MAG: hypothetical protein JWO72_2248 [Caulobacteraceae bacterium]|jgi:hypothetical protein|nr:hypothetical protein [Caulobacteraceae bacterium]